MGTLDNKYALVSAYLDHYPELLSPFEKSCLLDYVKHEYESSEMIPDLVREVYDELGLLPDNKNIYLGFINMVKRLFGTIDKHIIEIGGGILPRLGERISLGQSVGSITVYDPRLAIHKQDTDKLKLVRKKFSKNNITANTNLLLGLMPCEATESIIDAALDNNIDFMIALCEGGNHGDCYDYYEDDEEWRLSIMSYARRGVEENGLGILGVEYMEEYNNPYPVIYNKRK